MIDVREVDYSRAQEAEALVSLLNAYAVDPFGGGHALADEVKASLAERLALVPGARSFIAWHEDQAVGLLNSFTGFSTFNARPLLNIHDVYVTPEMRGQGVLEKLFAAIEARAAELGCCKLTLEVLQMNERAKQGYTRLGYGKYDLGDTGGEALFWQKKLI